MSKKYRKKPVVIEAVQWNGDNYDEVKGFCGEWLILRNRMPDGMRADNPPKEWDNLIIRTLEGTHIASLGDYIIKGVQGEFYPCKPDIFTETYEEI